MSSVQNHPVQPATVRAPKAVFDMIDAHVVILNNYLRPHHVAAYQEIQKRVRKLTVLLSVPMEPDRSWEAQWGDLDVIVQKNHMFTAKWKHSTGFSEDNFIHVPVDTNKQLRRLKPDVILSYEMGMRTMLCSMYRCFRSRCKLVMVGNMSEHIESERGWLRRLFRSAVVKGVDFFTYNGPSCKRYLESLNISANRIFHFPYCIDPDTIGENFREAGDPAVRKMLYCGAMSMRKGILQFSEVAKNWCRRNPGQVIELSIAGGGDLKDQIEKLSEGNFRINLLGSCDPQQLQAAYRDAELCVFPSLADEWGLVPIEAMASGLPVLGSYYAQSVEACVVDGQNGWVFLPDDAESVEQAINRVMKTSPEVLLEMGDLAKDSVKHITPEYSADEICKLIAKISQQ